MKKIKEVIQPFLKKKIPDVRPGDTVKVYQRFKEISKKKKEAKDKIQIFEGIVIARRHGKEIGATITVRKVIGGVGVERIFPLHLPTIEKIEILRRSKTRRAKLYFLRTAKGKRARLKKKEFVEAIVEEEPKQEIKTEEKAEEMKNTEKQEVELKKEATKQVPQEETKTDSE